MSKPVERWDNDDSGELDDVVVPDVSCFRLERMNTGQWWIGLYRPNGELIHIDIGAKNPRCAVIASRRED